MARATMVLISDFASGSALAKILDYGMAIVRIVSMAMTRTSARPGALSAACLMALCMVLVSPAAVQAQILCRISTENPSSHVQARALRKFSDLLRKRAGSALKVEYYDGATLYRDANALAALARGDLEMAAPGIWQFDKVAPDTAAMMLPTLYARNQVWIRGIVDGELGLALSRSIEPATRTVVLGAWLDLGYGHIFSVHGRIKSIADIRGKRIRVAGGKGNEERIRALGGSPVSIALSDLPVFIEQNKVDGVLTTYETIDSAGLDAMGLRTVLEDREYYPFYVPLVSTQFWDRLDGSQRLMFTSTWAEVVATFRDEAVKAQEDAKRNLVGRGMMVYVPTGQEQAIAKARLLAGQSDMAGRLSVSPAILAVLERLDGAGDLK